MVRAFENQAQIGSPSGSKSQPGGLRAQNFVWRSAFWADLGSFLMDCVSLVIAAERGSIMAPKFLLDCSAGL